MLDLNLYKGFVEDTIYYKDAFIDGEKVSIYLNFDDLTYFPNPITFTLIVKFGFKKNGGFIQYECKNINYYQIYLDNFKLILKCIQVSGMFNDSNVGNDYLVIDSNIINFNSVLENLIHSIYYFSVDNQLYTFDGSIFETNLEDINQCQVLQIPTKQTCNKHEMYMKKALCLSKKSYELYGAPFGAIVVLNDKIIGYGLNNIKCNYSLHAEINAMVEASKYLGCKDLSSCVLYTTIEPCPMCAFMAREYKLTSIYIGLNSPYMGGYSKWNILKDKQLSNFTPYFDKVPDVHFNILYKENKDFIDETPFNKYFGITPNKPCVSLTDH